jgi:hypothetical protein
MPGVALPPLQRKLPSLARRFFVSLQEMAATRQSIGREKLCQAEDELVRKIASLRPQGQGMQIQAALA